MRAPGAQRSAVGWLPRTHRYGLRSVRDDSWRSDWPIAGQPNCRAGRPESSGPSEVFPDRAGPELPAGPVLARSTTEPVQCWPVQCWPDSVPPSLSLAWCSGRRRWRCSTAISYSEKPYAVDAGEAVHPDVAARAGHRDVLAAAGPGRRRVQRQPVVAVLATTCSWNAVAYAASQLEGDQAERLDRRRGRPAATGCRRRRWTSGCSGSPSKAIDAASAVAFSFDEDVAGLSSAALAVLQACGSQAVDLHLVQREAGRRGAGLPVHPDAAAAAVDG